MDDQPSKPKHPGGRPSKFDACAPKILLAVRAGNYYDTAAWHAGCHPDSLKNWLRKGEAAKSGKYKKFFLDLKKAEANADVEDLAKIKKDRTWQSRAWRLERKTPAKWGRRDPTLQMVTLREMYDFGTKMIMAINRTITDDGARVLLVEEIQTLMRNMKSKYPHANKKNGNGNGNSKKNGGNGNGPNRSK